MRQNTMGRKVTLKDDLVGVLMNNLPQGVEDEIESFLNSKDGDKMLDLMLNVIDDHVDYVVQSIRAITA